MERDRKPITEGEIEGKLRAYFEAERASLKAPANLWEKVKGRLGEATKEGGHMSFWQRFPWPRRVRLLPALATAAVLLLVISGGWLLATAPWQGGGPAAPLPSLPDSRLVTLTMGTPVPMPGAPGLPGPQRAKLGGAEELSYGLERVTSESVAGGEAAGSIALETALRQVIMTASISLEVEKMGEAVAQVQAIAENLGGRVQQLSRSGGPEKEQATITIRVAQENFFTALKHLEALGEVKSSNVGSEDVTEKFIDLEARLKSLQQEEQSLLSLLQRATTVSEILTIERELSRVRSDIERYQGQLNFLKGRVELATITVSLSMPKKEAGQPPSASFLVAVPDVPGSVERVKAQVALVKGELDSVTISVKDGKETAYISLRVFSQDFTPTLASIEREGRVHSKELREGTTPEKAEPPEKPDASITVSFVEGEGFWTAGRIIAIAAPAGGVALAILLGSLALLAYRAGRKAV